MKLLLFPFAGGNSYSYTPLIKHFPKSIRPVTVELPGRGTRIDEPLKSSVDEIISDIFEKYNKVGADYSIFGHSFGTLLGILFARQMIDSKLEPPRHLFFSGHGWPGCQSELKFSQLSNEDFLNEMRQLGGSPDEVLNNTEIMDFFLPILRSDFKALESYKYQSGLPLDIPITLLCGEDDGNTTDENLQLWKNETTAQVEMLKFPGNHFFLFEQPLEIADVICRKISG
jgi:surfactin synthase thioesterase subunit